MIVVVVDAAKGKGSWRRQVFQELKKAGEGYAYLGSYMGRKVPLESDYTPFCCKWQ